MFYNTQLTKALRFGDIVRGFVVATPKISKPHLSGQPDTFAIQVHQTGFFAILSPCCSISDKIISIAPLKQIRPAFLKNPYFAEDLIRLNQEMEPQNTVPPRAWEAMPEAEQIRRESAGRGYAFLELFIYAEHIQLSRYTLNQQGGPTETGYYMIDFRDAQKLDCESVISPTNAPLDSKCLELSVATRSELRKKIAHFYSRVPAEDSVAET